MTSLFSSLAHNLGGQLIARTLSFVINMYLLRRIDNDVLGLVNVRLTLLYSSILFLTREPLRKAAIQRGSLPKFINILWLSPLISTVLSVIGIYFWCTFSSTSDDVSWNVLLSFPISAIIESIAEPFSVISLRLEATSGSLGQHFAIGQGILICVKRIFVLAGLFIFPQMYHLDLFAYSQYFGAITYLLFNFIAFYFYVQKKSIPELQEFSNFSDLFPKIEEGIDRDSVNAVFTLFAHSILKQLLTDGSSYVMTFTELLTLKQQAVYDAVERLGSIVVRTVLSPIDENCNAYFSNTIRKESGVFNRNTDNHDELIKNLTTILHVVGVIGFVACVFGIPYSSTAIGVYGGSLLSDNGGALLLSLYSGYILVTAINGITEGFAMASMNNYEIYTHGKFLFVTSALHLFINYVLCVYINSAGFIVANIINMTIRIIYNWRRIKEYLGERTPSFTTVFPTFATSMFLGASLFATSFSYLIFATTPGMSHILSHVAIGAVCFGLIAQHTIQHDSVFAGVINTFMREHQE
uniref:Protein RFT1 homolog n=1 Tax=Caenorhabditis tropicalis TaxID=1561998 RepID=A0A1I7TDU9_9PELO